MTTGRGIVERDVELVGDAGYAELLSEIRRELQRSRIKATRAVNAEMIGLYWRIGKMILERQEAEGWGAKVIEQLAADLKEEAPRGFSRSNLHYMRAFAEAWPDFSSGRAAIVQQAVGQLPWGHNVLLLTKLKTPKDRLWYAERAASEGWSRHMLTHHIATELKERQGTGKSNFKATLAPADSDLAQEMLTDPLDLSFVPGEAVRSERDLELALLEDVETFMLSVGGGQLTFAGRQKELQIDGESFFLDLLFFHVRLLRWVVVELKVGKFEPAFTGQLNFYVNAVDGELRQMNHGETIGILLCAERNEQVVEYSLKDVQTPIGIATYETDRARLTNELPPEFEGQLPNPGQLQAGLRRIAEERANEIESVLGS